MKPEVLLRFSYKDDGVTDAEMIDYGCPHAIVFIGGQARPINKDLAELLSFDNSSAWTKRPATDAPDLFGLKASDANAVARKHGFYLESSGELIDQELPDDSVLLQGPAAGYGGIGNQIDILIAVHEAPTCSFDQLAFDWYEGGYGAGNDFGTIDIRDVSSQTCTLRGPITVTGLDAKGTPDTSTLKYDVQPDLVLSANQSRRGQQTPAGEMIAALRIGAEYRDDPLNQGLSCTKHQVDPVTWLLQSAFGSRKVPNEAPNQGSLTTCRGELNPPDPIAPES
ncbi:MAG: hypothetical protein ACYDCC_07995 [Actinomycetota bacterium]